MTKRSWFLFAAMAVLWGIPYLLIRVAVREISPGILVFGVIEFGIPWFFMGTAERHITSSLTSLIICSVPLVSIIFARYTSAHEPLHAKRALGLAVGALGVALLVGLDVGHGSGPWIVVMGMVCIGYAVGPIVLATKLSHVPGPAVVCGATAMVALGWLPYALTHLPHHAKTETFLSVATLSVFCTATAFLVFFALIKDIGSSRSLVVVYANTGIAVALGIAFLREPLTLGIIMGFPLIVAGSYLATTTTATDGR